MFELERNPYEIDLSEMKVVWAGWEPIFVPKRYSILEEKYLIASQLTLQLRNVSVDNVLKNWMDNFEEDRENKIPNPKEIILDEILIESKKYLTHSYERLSKIQFTNETVASFATETVFLRLSASFRSAHYLIKFGYYFESFAIIRLILEQLAYAYTASQIQEGEDFISPSNSIRHLKKLIPQAGKLYGELSKKTHVDKSEVGNFIKNNGVILNSIDFSIETALYLLVIIDIHETVFEFGFRNFLRKFNNIEKQGDLYVNKDVRQTKKIYLSMREKVLKLYKEQTGAHSNNNDDDTKH